MKSSSILYIVLFCFLALSCKSILINKYSKGKDKFNDKTLPSIQLYDESNTVFDLHRIDSEVTMINFWGTWCPPCLIELPEINNLIVNLEEQSDINIINVCVDCPIDEWKSVVSENNLLGINLMADSSSSKILRSWSDYEAFPFNIVLNSKKQIVAKSVLEVESAQLMTVYTLLNVKDGWTGSQSFKDFMQKSSNISKSAKENDRFYQFFEKFVEKYTD